MSEPTRSIPGEALMMPKLCGGSKLSDQRTEGDVDYSGLCGPW